MVRLDILFLLNNVCSGGLSGYPPASRHGLSLGNSRADQKGYAPHD
jgi:hypothetical protein